MMDERLIEIREEIDKIDEEIVKLIHERFQNVLKVGDLKRQKYGDEFLYIDPKRENEIILNHVKSFQNIQLEADLAYNLWRNIISFANFAEQSHLRINYHDSLNAKEVNIIQKIYPNVSQHRHYKDIEAVAQNNASIFAINPDSEDSKREIKYLNGNFFFAYNLQICPESKTKILFLGKILKTYQEEDGIFLFLNTNGEIKYVNKQEFDILKTDESQVFIGSSAPS